VREVLARLDGVRQTGPDRWVALCPAHDDRRPSLSLREGRDGRVLLHCFAGCGGLAVLDALGLEWRDLYPRPAAMYRYASYAREARREDRPPRLPAYDALTLLDREATVVELVAERLLRGDPVERHAECLKTAARRIAVIRQGWMEAPR